MVNSAGIRCTQRDGHVFGPPILAHGGAAHLNAMSVESPTTEPSPRCRHQNVNASEPSQSIPQVAAGARHSQVAVERLGAGVPAQRSDSQLTGFIYTRPLLGSLGRFRQTRVPEQ